MADTKRMAPHEPATPSPQHPAPAAPAQTGSIPAVARPGSPQLSTEITPVTDPIISVRGLKKTYGITGANPVTALDDISVDFPRGQFTAIMGSSGSGKSSLLHCLVGLDGFQEGIVKVANQNLTTMTSAELTEFRRAAVGFIFQSYNLIPTLSARENIEIAAELQRVPVNRQHFKALVKRLDLGRLLDAFPAQLTGGQQQKVACARALLTRPAVVVADEPTGNLDSESAAQVLGFLRGAAADWGQSVVMATHEVDAAKYAGQVLFLHDGRLVAQLTNPTREAILEAQQALGQRLAAGDAGSLGATGISPRFPAVSAGNSTDSEPLGVTEETGNLGAITADSPSLSADAAAETATRGVGLGSGSVPAPASSQGWTRAAGQNPRQNEGQNPIQRTESSPAAGANQAEASPPPEKPAPRRSSWRNRKKRRPVVNPEVAKTFATLGIAETPSEPNELADSLATGRFKWPSLSEASPDMNDGDNDLLGQPLGNPPATLASPSATPDGVDEPGDATVSADTLKPRRVGDSPKMTDAPSPDSDTAGLAPHESGIELPESTTDEDIYPDTAAPRRPVPAPAPPATIPTSTFAFPPMTHAARDADLATPNLTLDDATQTGAGFLSRVATPGYGFVPDEDAAPSDLFVTPAAGEPDSLGASQNPRAVPEHPETPPEIPDWARQVAALATDSEAERTSSLASSGWETKDTDSRTPHESAPSAPDAATALVGGETAVASSDAARPGDDSTAAFGAESAREESAAMGSESELARPLRRRRRSTVDPHEAELAGQNELLQMIAQAEQLLAASSAAISDAQDALAETGSEPEPDVSESAANVSETGEFGASSATAARPGTATSPHDSGVIPVPGGTSPLYSTLGDTAGLPPVERSLGAVATDSLGTSPARDREGKIGLDTWRSPSTSTFTRVKGNSSLAELARSLGLDDVVTAGRENPVTGANSRRGTESGGAGGWRSSSQGVSSTSSASSLGNSSLTGGWSGKSSISGGRAGAVDSALGTIFGTGNSDKAVGSGNSANSDNSANPSDATSPADRESGLPPRGATPNQELLIARADAMLAQASAQSQSLQQSLLNLENPAGSSPRNLDATGLAPHESDPRNYGTTDPAARNGTYPKAR